MPAPGDRPNVLCFVADQLRYDDVGCMGNDTIETPTIDTLANEGVLCERAHVTSPACMPSRASMFTGRMPQEVDVRFNTPLDTEAPTLPGILRDAGYRTYSAGKIHLNHYSTPSGIDATDLDPERHPECLELWNRGLIDEIPTPYYGIERVDHVSGHTSYASGEYRRWLEAEHPDLLRDISRADPIPDGGQFHGAPPAEVHYNRWIADRTCSFLRDTDDPFFAWCSFPDPHPGFHVPDPWDDMYDPAEMRDPVRREGELDDLPRHHRERANPNEDVDARKAGMATYYGMTSFVDREMGRVMETLEAEGLRENTIVLFLSDHGHLFGDHWQTHKDQGVHFDDLTRVPFVWSYPEALPTGRRVESAVSTLDLLPTLLDLCDVSYSAPGYDGYAEPDCGVPALPGTSLVPLFRDEADAAHDGVIVAGDTYYGGIRARTLVTDRYRFTTYPDDRGGELFDLEEDPEELYNRWDDPEYAEVRDRLAHQFVETYVRSESGLPRRPGQGA